MRTFLPLAAGVTLLFTGILLLDGGRSAMAAPGCPQEWVPDANTLGLWHFNEPSGPTALDSSSNGNNGTINGGVSRVPGIFNGALSFPVSNGYVSAPDDPSLDVGTGDFTLEACIRTTANHAPQAMVIAAKDVPDTGAGYSIAVTANNKAHCGIRDFNAAMSDPDWIENFPGTTDVNDGNWHHIRCVRQGSDLRLYVDGVLEAQTTIAPTLGSLDNPQQFVIGVRVDPPASVGNPHFFEGLIDEVRLSNIARPPAFTPTYTQTIDDAAPDDRSVIPVSDTCEIGVPCKSYFHLTIPNGQPGTQFVPGLGVQGVVPESIATVFGDAAVPDGAIVGRNFGSVRSNLIGSCSSGTVNSFDEVVYEATTDHSTTTGNPSDLSSFFNWPLQLDGTVADVATAHPGSTLRIRWVIPGSGNILIFDLIGGETFFLSVSGDPTTSPVFENCGPHDSNFLLLGLSLDNPDTAGVDEGGVPLSTCVTTGTSTFELTLDRNDTPPGDITTLFDTTSCTQNTPPGTSVQVPLLGGTSSIGGIDASFDQVTTEGSTSATGSTSGPPPPTGFQVIGLGAGSTYYDINTTAGFTGPVTLCVHYDNSGLSAAEESALKLMQFDGTTFIDRTISLDTATNIICASAPSFSTWAVMIAVPPVGGTVDLLGGRGDGGSLTPYILLGAIVAIAGIGAAGALATRRRRHTA